MAEHEKSEHSALIEKQTKDIFKLKQQIDKLSSAANEANAMRDEVEELRHEAVKVAAFILLCPVHHILRSRNMNAASRLMRPRWRYSATPSPR